MNNEIKQSITDTLKSLDRELRDISVKVNYISPENNTYTHTLTYTSIEQLDSQ